MAIAVAGIAVSSCGGVGVPSSLGYGTAPRTGK